jgi:hypothetical protein
MTTPGACLIRDAVAWTVMVVDGVATVVVVAVTPTQEHALE